MKIFIVAAVILSLLMGDLSVRAQTPNRAGVVVQFSNGSTQTRCVSFTEDSISGYDLLRRSKLPIAVDFGSFGAAVCKIGNEGCSFPSEGCFCKCQTLGAGCMYWVYSQLNVSNGAWTISGLGAGNRQVRNGDVDGWRWGKGNGDSGEVPVSVTFDSVCSASAMAQTQPIATKMAPTPASTTKPPTAVPQSSPTAATLPTLELQPATPSPTAQANSTTAPMPTDTPQTPSTQPTLLTPVAPDVNQQPTPNTLPYLAFGGIVIALLVGLAIARRSGGNA